MSVVRLAVVVASVLTCSACSAPPERTREAQGVDPFARHDAPSAKRAFEIADFYAAAVVGAPSLAPDETTAVFGVRRYDLTAGKSWSQIWRARLADANVGALTSGQHNDTDPQYTPDGGSIVFLSNRGGSSQVWTMPTDGGEPRQLTSFAPGIGSALLSPDGRWLAVTAELFPECGLDLECHERNAKGLEGKLQVRVADELLYRHWTSWHQGKRTHILLVDAASGAVVKDLTPGPFDAPGFSLGGRALAWSPDSKELCYVANHDADAARSTNSDLFAVAIEGELTPASARNLTADNKGWDGAPLYSPDGKWIAFIRQLTPGYESDLRQLALLERSSGAVTYLTTRESFDDWVEDMRWASSSEALVFQAEHEGRNPLFYVELESAGSIAGVLEHGHINGWELTRAGEVVYSQRAVAQPSELFTTKLGEAPRRVTHFNQALESQVDIRPAAELWLEGDGGRPIHTFVVTPHGFDPSKRYPLILNVHGGPQSQWTDAFRGDWQVYPGKGYIVAFCNPTGSTGYGQDFTDAITGEWGGKPFRDLMKVCDALERLPFVDKERMGVMGWSYGGYMAMWMQGHTDRFKANAAMMGLYDLRSFYGATEELWFPEHDLKGEPWTSALYERWSPSNYVENFKTPALVIGGELDYRVPYTQSLQYFTALQRRGVPSRLVMFPNAGHWPAWHEMAFYYNVHLDFFQRYLGGGAAPWKVDAHARNLQFAK
jgi:dipeptidyl aminopeptidase/acylaminoacyl peptidase